jgi:hypothetical protein
MELNKNKCGVMWISTQGELTKKEKLQEGISDIPFVTEYKYLGVKIKKNLRLQLHHASIA